MKKLGDKVIANCEKCKNNQTFTISEISEYGEIFGDCDECKNTVRL